MPTNNELKTIQKQTLHKYLLIKHDLRSRNIESKPLEETISETIAGMDAEDVAYVQKVVEKLIG